ncbi:MAG: DUF2953 domain-containing protein [Litoreibacter sp.]|nr:DUF2953 domain-containing protein [Litoreibacter sp.]
MGLIGSLILWSLLGLLLALVLLLVTPLRLLIRATSQPRVNCQIAVQPLGGVCPPVQILDTAKPRRKKKHAQKPHQARRKKGRFPEMTRRTRAILSGAPELIGGLLRRITIDRLSLDAEFGLGDPAETGHLYGIVTPVLFGIPAISSRPVSLRPNFERATLSGDVNAQLSVIPATLARPLLRFAWHVFRADR